MLYLFHGDNQLASRNGAMAQLEQAKHQQSGAELIRLDGEKITETDLLESLETQSLLGNAKIIFINNLLSRRVSKEKDNLMNRFIRIYCELQPSPTVVLWEPKAVMATALKKFATLSNVRVQEFKLTKTLFKFLDAFRPGNNASMHALFEQTLKTDAAELVFFLLAKRLNQLFIAKSGDSESLKKELRQDWQIRNVQHQASAWTDDQLASVNRKLLDIDESIKTGASPIDLALQLDILLLTL